jgi:hypothetical protein
VLRSNLLLRSSFLLAVPLSLYQQQNEAIRVNCEEERNREETQHPCDRL